MITLCVGVSVSGWLLRNQQKASVAGSGIAAVAPTSIPLPMFVEGTIYNLSRRRSGGWIKLPAHLQPAILRAY